MRTNTSDILRANLIPSNNWMKGIQVMLKRLFLGIVTLTIIMLANTVLAHPSIKTINSKDLDALEDLASNDLSKDDLAKFRSTLNAFRQKPKSKAPFGTSFSYPSHEIMTDQSAGNVGLRNKKLKFQLINGAIWNDDPTGLVGWRKTLYESGFPKRWGLIFLYSEMLTGLGIQIGKDNLIGRSHFGDMQYLHAMSFKSKTPPDITQKKIINWCKFSYRVATGEIDLDDKVSEHFNSVTIGKTLTINELFNDNAPFFALGTIAHLIQDSYSQSHVLRDESDHILAFLVFQEQNSDNHKVLDKKNAYVKSGGWTKAIQHVGKILEFVIKKEPWTKVEAFLCTQVFQLSDRAQPSSGGGV